MSDPIIQNENDRHDAAKWLDEQIEHAKRRADDPELKSTMEIEHWRIDVLNEVKAALCGEEP